MRVLVTGALSLSGKAAVAHLSGLGHEVYATDMAAEADGKYRASNLTDPASLKQVCDWAQPKGVLHIAGVAARDRDLCFEVNVQGMKNLFGSLPQPARIVTVSSSAVYGLTRDDESPLGEDIPLRPAGAYGESKAAGEQEALAEHGRGEHRISVVRPFNLLGRGLRLGLAPADFLEQIRRIRAGEAAPLLRVGNLEARRDYIDVRDAVSAYTEVLLRPDLGGEVFNAASGSAVRIRDILELLLEVSGTEVAVEVDPAKLRPVEVLLQSGDSSKLRAATGWAPHYSLRESLADMAEADNK